ncbi:MAG TPA: hypothetical protein DDW52_06175 [Planctomycetaceae bacterium]|nr:hypothetical protein [Planctomycetaceae bacterium]
MQRLVSLPIFAALVLTTLASKSHLLAGDLDELLRTDVAWTALSEEEKRPIVPALKALLCAEHGRCSVLDGPPLNPARAYHDAEKELVNSMKAVVESVGGQSGQALVDSLVHLQSQASLNSRDIESLRPQLAKTLIELSAEAPILQTHIKLANAVESFLFLERYKEEYRTEADFSDKLLPKLQKTLIDYAAAPRGEPERENLGNVFRLVEACSASDRTVNIDGLLTELRKLCKRPNLWLFISDDLINAFVDSAVNLPPETQSVDECILGTSIQGTAIVYPAVGIVLRENPSYAALTVKLDGNATSNTIGYQKPVRILATGQSSFWSNKCLDIPNFVTSPASASACTDTVICSIQKVGRQCLSRLIERIAWKRALQQKPQADLVASRKFARRVETSFDERLDPLMAKAKKFYFERFLYALRRLQILPTDPSFSSTTKALGIGATFAKRDQVGSFLTPPASVAALETKPDLTVKIHDSFFWNTFESERKVPADALDKLVDEFLSNLPGSSDSAFIADSNPQFFKVIAEAVLMPNSQRAGFLQENLPSSGKLTLVDVEYRDSWVIVHWKMVPEE